MGRVVKHTYMLNLETYLRTFVSSSHCASAKAQVYVVSEQSVQCMDYYSNIPASKGSNKVDDSITSGDITADVAVSFAESARKDVHLKIEME